MRIAHISDVHIRNLKYHDDYNRVFDNLYEKLRELKPDIVINTGDLAHTKTDISPEFVDMCSKHIRTISDIAPYHILLGNHDLNLQNPNRRDAISPIVDSIGGTKFPIMLHKDSGLSFSGKAGDLKLNVWSFSCADQTNFPEPNEWADSDDAINIGLYHGSLLTAETDIGWRMSSEDDLKMFSGLDFVLLGDIHKFQFLDPDGRVAYAGSLIQQNFGETPDKGFLVWDIKDKNDFKVEHVKLNGDKKFFTIRLNDDLSVPDINLDPGNRVRIIAPKSYTLVEQQAFEKEVREKFEPFSCISIAARSVNIGDKTAAKNLSVKLENLRDPVVQERLINDFLRDRKLSKPVMEKILELNSKYHMFLEKNEDVIRNTSWNIDSIAWNNMFNYGEDNSINFHKTGGVIGIFAPNSSGKSSLIDILTESLFDKTSKSVSKNVYLINDNKEAAQMIVQMTISGRTYVIERTINRIKYGKNKDEKEKQWGKTSLNFYEVNEDETIRSLNGTLRSATEKSIRRLIGSHSDFLLTTFLAQKRENDIIDCKETDRRKILSRFMDLDMFEQKALLAKEDSRQYTSRLKDAESSNLDITLASEELLAIKIRTEIHTNNLAATKHKNAVESYQTEIVSIDSRKINVDCELNLKDIESRQKKIESTKSVLLTELRLHVATKDRNNTTISELESEIEDVPGTSELTESLKRLTDLQQQQELLAADIEFKRKIIKSHETEISVLSKVPCGSKFPKCHFLVGAFEKQKQLPSKYEELDKLAKKLDLTTTEVSELKALRLKEQVNNSKKLAKSLASSKNEVRIADLSIENVKLRFESEKRNLVRAQADLDRFLENQESIEKNLELENEKDKVLQRIAGEKSKISALNKTILSLSKDLGAKENMIDRISEELKNLEEVKIFCDAYEHYLEAMGKNGIAYQILVDRLPILNDEINKILSSVSDFNVFLEHDEDERSIKLLLQYNDYKSRLLELGGGAERELASIAIRTALLNITSLPKTNMFIIDEGFGKLDPKNMDNVGKMFDYLRSVFDHVIIISHIDILKDMVDTSIEITSDEEKYSHIEVG